MTAEKKNVRSILLITLSNIGDAIMTTPVMEALHGKYPLAMMDIVCDARSSQLFEHCPYRGQLIHRDKQLGWRGTVSLLRQLRQQEYDLIVDLRTDGLAWLLRTGRRLTRRGSKPAGFHAVERHMGVILKREGISRIPPLQVWLTETHHRFADTVLKDLPGERWLALGPGAKWGPKCWPVQYFRELAERQSRNFDAIALLGSQQETSKCCEVTDSLSIPCLDLAGRTDLLQAAAILARMQAFIGNDSGLGHLAAAVGIPTLTLFGTGEPERYSPWSRRGVWIQSKTRDIKDLAVAEVMDAVEKLLGRPGTSRA